MTVRWSPEARTAVKHLTPKDLAERCNVPVGTVYQWNSRGGGPRFLKIGGHVRYRLADVEEWEQSQLTASGGGEAA